MQTNGSRFKFQARGAALFIETRPLQPKLRWSALFVEQKFIVLEQATPTELVFLVWRSIDRWLLRSPTTDLPCDVAIGKCSMSSTY